MDAYISVKGQIVIPAALRHKYGLKPGMTVKIVDSGDGILLKPITEQTIQKLEGVLKGKGGLNLLMEERNRDNSKENL